MTRTLTETDIRQDLVIIFQNPFIVVQIDDQIRSLANTSASDSMSERFSKTK